jgi:hypothetical protein
VRSSYSLSFHDAVHADLVIVYTGAPHDAAFAGGTLLAVGDDGRDALHAGAIAAKAHDLLVTLTPPLQWNASLEPDDTALRAGFVAVADARHTRGAQPAGWEAAVQPLLRFTVLSATQLQVVVPQARGLPPAPGDPLHPVTL